MAVNGCRAAPADARVGRIGRVGRANARRVGGRGRRCGLAGIRPTRTNWWRWGRVELPVQKPSPETTTSVSDSLSSNARPTIGNLPSAPVTFPFGL